MDSKTKTPYIDLNYEEISPDRNLDGAWSNGLHSYRFSVAPSGGGCVIPSMSYFQVEYNFGSMAGAADKYTATQALKQSQKIALQNNFMSCAYNACRFTAAQSEISVVNSSHAQTHTLKRRMGYDTTFMEQLGADLNGFDPDFSRRLARTCSDGVYHRDGLIDATPYDSYPLSSDVYTNSPAFNQVEQLLTRNVVNDAYNGTVLYGDTTHPVNGNFTQFFSGLDGTGNIVFNAADGVAVGSFLWKLGDYSAVRSGNAVTNAAIIDANHISAGDQIVFIGLGATAFDSYVCTVYEKRVSANASVLVITLPFGGSNVGIMKTALGNAAGPKANTGILSIKSVGGSDYSQPDPRSNMINNVIMYQPPLSFFDISDPDIFFGDMEIQMTPNPNFATACIESCAGGYYSTDVKHGVDYAFGIKSVRLYLARARLLVTPPTRATFTTRDFQVSNKQLTGGSSVINFNIPPSTQMIVCWIQDGASGTHSRLPMTRFKTRQDTGAGGLARLNRYGPWAHTYDERLTQLQLNFAGTTKPLTSFQRGSGAGSVSDPTVNNMLQRWMMSSQNDSDRQKPEKYTDWLNNGGYYLFDFSRSADNSGTHLTAYITYDGNLPTDGNSLTSTTPSNVNFYVCSIYDRDVAITYSEYGNIVSANTQMR